MLIILRERGPAATPPDAENIPPARPAVRDRDRKNKPDDERRYDITPRGRYDGRGAVRPEEELAEIEMRLRIVRYVQAGLIAMAVGAVGAWIYWMIRLWRMWVS